MQSRASEPGSRPASATGQLFLRFLRFYPKSSHRPCPRGRGELGTPAQAREELLPLSPSSSPSCLPPPTSLPLHSPPLPALPSAPVSSFLWLVSQSVCLSVLLSISLFTSVSFFILVSLSSFSAFVNCFSLSVHLPPSLPVPSTLSVPLSPASPSPAPGVGGGGAWHRRA